MQYILECKDIIKTYDTFTLGPISMEVRYGEIVGLVGENGAGKTTLISAILNQIKCESGSIKLFGLDNIKHDLDCKRKIGFVIDECCFHGCLCAKDINGIMQRIYSEWKKEVFWAQLETLKIPLRKKISEFSKGMKNKLMLAVALAHKPRFLVLDEITSGLDPIVRDDILKVLKEYVTQTNASILFSTHITSDLDKIADAIVILQNGKLVFSETKEHLRACYGLIRCAESDIGSIPQTIMIRKLCDGDMCSVLIHDDNLMRSDHMTIPSIDEVMLMYIKGDAK